MNFPSKKVWIPVVIFLLFVIIILIIYSSLVSSKTVEAQLSVEEGAVFVNGEQVTEYSELKQGDVVETGEDGLATVILYESVVVNIDPNTKINIDDLTKEHPKISQEGGETWNQFTKLFGVEEYTIKAGNSVASVRGTAFAITEEKIVVDEGEVEYEIGNQKFNVLEGRVIEKIREEIKEREITQEEKDKIKLKEERIIKQLENLREREIKKHPKVLNYVKDKFSLEDKDIKEAFKEIDEGKKDINELEKKSPVKVESIDKIKRITEIIQEKKGINVTQFRTTKTSDKEFQNQEKTITNNEISNQKSVASNNEDSLISSNVDKTPATTVTNYENQSTVNNRNIGNKKLVRQSETKGNLNIIDDSRQIIRLPTDVK